MHTSIRTLISIVLPSMLLVGVLAGCSDNAEPAPASTTTNKDNTNKDSTTAKSSAGQATFSAAGREFTIDLAGCTVYQDEEVALSGPAREKGGSAEGYFDGDAMNLSEEPTGEFRIDIGATGPNQSTDEFIAMGNSSGGDLSIDKNGENYQITAKAWDADGKDLGSATLAFSCS